MKRTKLLSVALLAIGITAIARSQVVLYNNLSTPANAGYGDTDGGYADFGLNYGDQCGQVFTNTNATSISQVESLYMGFDSSSNATGLLVQVFNFSGGVVGSEVGEQTVSSYTESDGTNATFGLAEWDITASGLNIGGLAAGAQYLLVMQLQSQSWGYQENDASGVPGAYVRNYSSFGYSGGFTSTWTELSQTGNGYLSGNNEMIITGQTQAVPSPAGILALGLGLGALLLRKRIS